jgi:hypothetical protein
MHGDHKQQQVEDEHEKEDDSTKFSTKFTTKVREGLVTPLPQ